MLHRKSGKVKYGQSVSRTFWQLTVKGEERADNKSVDIRVSLGLNLGTFETNTLLGKGKLGFVPIVPSKASSQACQGSLNPKRT